MSIRTRLYWALLLASQLGGNFGAFEVAAQTAPPITVTLSGSTLPEFGTPSWTRRANPCPAGTADSTSITTQGGALRINDFDLFCDHVYQRTEAITSSDVLDVQWRIRVQFATHPVAIGIIVSDGTKFIGVGHTSGSVVVFTADSVSGAFIAVASQSADFSKYRRLRLLKNADQTVELYLDGTLVASSPYQSFNSFSIPPSVSFGAGSNFEQSQADWDSVSYTINPPANCGWAPSVNLPTARTALAVVGSGGQVYALGGTPDTSGSIILSTVEVFDPTNGTWSLRSPMPTARALFGAAELGGILYAVGGCAGIGCTAPLGFVDAHDPSTDTWLPRASMPTPRYGLGVGVVNGILYAVGGDATPGGAVGNIVGTLEAYDPSTDTWTTRTSMPTPRRLLSVAVVNGMLYAIGGRNASNVSLDTVEAYDPATDTWTTVASMPTARTTLATTAMNGLIYAVGGFDTDVVSFPTVEVYDPISDGWVIKPPLSVPRGGLGIASVDGLLYAVAGSSAASFAQGLDTVEALNPLCGTSSQCNQLVAEAGPDRIVRSGDFVVFDFSQSVCSAEAIRIDWNFGDGQSASGALVRHRFSEPGEYEVLITIEDLSGNIAMDAALIKVEPVRVTVSFSVVDMLGIEHSAQATAMYVWTLDVANGPLYSVREVGYVGSGMIYAQLFILSSPGDLLIFPMGCTTTGAIAQTLVTGSAQSWKPGVDVLVGSAFAIRGFFIPSTFGLDRPPIPRPQFECALATLVP